MWVLEHHPVEESNEENASFRVKRNTQPRLPTSAEGVEFTDTPTTDIPKPLNESYEVANPKLVEELREEVEDVIRTIEVPEPVSPFGYMDFSRNRER